MNDEEFKKKLETILENLYRIDQEAREYLGRKKLIVKKAGYRREPPGNDDSKSAENYKNEIFKIYNKKQQSL